MKPESASSDGVGGVDRREVDENIAYAVKTDEESYADQIASVESREKNQEEVKVESKSGSETQDEAQVQAQIEA